jgi:hypothetical protein
MVILTPRFGNEEASEVQARALGSDTASTLDADGLMADAIFKLRVRQLVSTLQAQGLDSESLAMLNLLESLVVAGEIEFGNFMQRVTNLFPHEFNRIDASLRDNLFALLHD